MTFRPAPDDARTSHREAADPDSRFLPVDGIDVHHKVLGDGDPTMLLFHHFYGNVLTWRRVLPGLAELGTAAAFDRPGFGFTERPPRSAWNGDNPYARAWSAKAATALLDHLGAEQGVLIGASAGGTAAIETTVRHPERVRALVLISPAITGDIGPPASMRPAINRLATSPAATSLVERFAGEITRDRVAGGWHDPTAADDTDVAAYQRVFDVDGWARGFIEVMTAEPPPDLRQALGRIHVPTLVVTGEHDRTISPAATRRTAAAIPGAEFVVIPRSGHTPHEERPERLVEEVRRFLGALVP